MSEAPKITMPELRWEYRPEWCAWWLMQSDNGVTAQRGFGPFNETEAQWAAEVHGVPFPAIRRAAEGAIKP